MLQRVAMMSCWSATLTLMVVASGCSTPPAGNGGAQNQNGGSGDQTGDGMDDGMDDRVSFSGQIQPIFTNRCIVCHAPGGIAQNQGIPQDLREGLAYDDLVGQPSVQDANLTLVAPGDAQSSLVFLKVSSDSPPVGSMMPLGGPALSDDEIELIRQWIDQGAEDN